MKIDWSKGTALHRLYGHYRFAMVAKQAGRDAVFVAHVCSAVKCTGASTDWRDNITV